MSRRHIALLNRIPWPLDDGWKVRTFHTVKALNRDAELVVISYGPASDEALRAFTAALGGRVKVRLVRPVRRKSSLRLLLGMVGPLPFYVVSERSRRYRAAVAAEMAAGCDLILCVLTAMYEQVRPLRPRAPVIIDTHNIDSLVFQRYAKSLTSPLRRLYAAITARKMERYEAVAFASVTAVVVCSDREVTDVKARAQSARVWVVPNGAPTPGPLPPPASSKRLLFFGRLDYHPNRDAIRYFLADVLPRLRARDPEVEFHVAGVGGDAELTEDLARAGGTTYHGRVDDMRALIAMSAVVVVPLRSGGGTRLKILEAMAAGRPVVSTTLGAEGLDLRAGTEIMIADDPVTFARAIQQVIDSPALADRVRLAAQRLIAERYDWNSIGEAFAQRVASS